MDSCQSAPESAKLSTSLERRKKRRSSFVRGRKSNVGLPLIKNIDDNSGPSEGTNDVPDNEERLLPNPKNVSTEKEIQHYENYMNWLNKESVKWNDMLKYFKDKAKQRHDSSEDASKDDISNEISNHKYLSLLLEKPSYEDYLVNLKCSMDKIALSIDSLQATSNTLRRFTNIVETNINAKIDDVEKTYGLTNDACATPRTLIQKMTKLL